VGYSLRLIGDIEVARKMPSNAQVAYAESLATGINRNDQWAIADSIGGLAAVASLNGDNALAARWLGAAEARYRRLLIGLPPPDQPTYHLLQEQLERSLPSEALEAEKIAGRNLTLDEIQAALPSLDPNTNVQSDQSVTEPHLPALTSREHQILRGITEGKTNREIAATLFISPRTVSWHVENILAKLGVESRTAAAIRATRRPSVD
jgi:DNA-binding CsgD family transcriptional regulator